MAQATSLGIEITFYLVSPWMLRSRSLSWITAAFGPWVWLVTGRGHMTDALFTYYNTPGPFPFYILGSFIFGKDWLSASLLFALTVGVLSISIGQHYNVESLVGLGVGVFALLVLTRVPANRLDTAFGNASYGTFVCHGVINAIFFWHFGSYTVDNSACV